MTYLDIDLAELRNNHKEKLPKNTFAHQNQALQNLNKVFDIDKNLSKSGLLVLPTGGGKTFTAVKWICDSIIPQNIKVLWFAHSFHLLDQACDTFKDYSMWISEKRSNLKIRVISSNPSHCNASEINETDDIIIMTTTTAINNFNNKSTDERGNYLQTAFQKYLDKYKDEKVLVILDEAHHSPAYGCRNLLMCLKEKIPQLFLLGLTATPTYTDESRRGWLKKIFEEGIIYEVRKDQLQLDNILARENFIQRETDIEMAVDDGLYNRLVREHKDLPEDIIEKLANNSVRNDFIVSEYLNNSELYGKTIIFADRWFQCIYLEEKLKAKNIRVGSIFSHIDASSGSANDRNTKTQDENKRIIEKFKNNEIDVLINVKMLTEGTDIPNTKTIFVTRNTTSQILLTQMVGRALRGKRAGGGSNKAEANIVFFNDKWKKLINWALPNLEGGENDSKSKIRGFYPLEYISINLIENLVKQLTSGIVFQKEPFFAIFPIGWYKTSIVINIQDSEEIDSFTEFVIVFNKDKVNFENYIEFALKNELLLWDKEDLDILWMEENLRPLIKSFFTLENNETNTKLINDLIKITRHIAQSRTKPDFYPFEEREKHDLDKLAQELMYKNSIEQDEILELIFNEHGNLWKMIFKNYYYFSTAVEGAIKRAIYEKKHNTKVSEKINTDTYIINNNLKRELTEDEKEQVKQRDNYKCLACEIIKEKGIRLEVDHIFPFALGGHTTIDNAQTLCSTCNAYKGTNKIDFRIHSANLVSFGDIDIIESKKNDYWDTALRRIINFFYKCHAVREIELHTKSNGKFYKKWQIKLYSGNNPKWLELQKKELLDFIHHKLEQYQVEDLSIIGTQNENYITEDPVSIYYNRGHESFNNENYESAINYYSKVINVDKNNFEVFFSRGNAYYYLNNYEKALLDYQKALEFEANNADVNFNIACVNSILGNKSDALKNLSNAIKYKSDYKEISKTNTDFKNIENELIFKNLIL